MHLGKASYRIHFKKTSLGVPLGMDSSHPQYIHESWMKAELTRIARNSSGYGQWTLGRRIFFDRLRNHRVPENVLARLEAFEPRVEQAVRRSLGDPLSRAIPQVPATPPAAEDWWLPLPFHPLWSLSGLQLSLDEFCSSLFWRSERAQAYGLDRMPREFIRIRVAWRLIGAPHSQSVRWLR